MAAGDLLAQEREGEPGEVRAAADAADDHVGTIRSERFAALVELSDDFIAISDVHARALWLKRNPLGVDGAVHLGHLLGLGEPAVARDEVTRVAEARIRKHREHPLEGLN